MGDGDVDERGPALRSIYQHDVGGLLATVVLIIMIITKENGYEAMSIFPSVGFLTRKCVRVYTIPGTDVTIDPGVNIVVPVKSLHLDPQYFQDPEEFRPFRYADADFIFIFSGERLGYMQSLAGLAAVLSQFSVAPCKSTLRKPIVDPTVMAVQSPKGGLPLALTPRKKTQ
ncbi:cytochrome P450 6B7-like [Cydia amplana]|uniref:cytochrome P450 6B7-like n=1 Tax=Cydia amplana TaxID=1869771 RepID=UPI002FE53120